MNNLKNVLIVKMSSIGDVIHAMPVSWAIKETYPKAKITWVVEKAALSLVKANPCVDRVILFKKEEFRASVGSFIRNTVALRRELRAEHYDLSLDLQGLIKSAFIVKLANADVKLGTADMRELSDKVSRRVTGKNAGGHIVERYLDVAREIGCAVKKVRFPLELNAREQKIAAQIAEKAGARLSSPYAILVAGSSWPSKCWSAKSFAEYSDWLYNQKIIPILAGAGAAEEQKAAEIESMTEIPPVNLVGKLSLAQLGFIMKKAALVVGSDTGPVHLGAGMGAKTIMLMGPTKPYRTGTYNQSGNIMVADRPCRECMKKVCPKGLDCLGAIKVADVAEKTRALLNI